MVELDDFGCQPRRKRPRSVRRLGEWVALGLLVALGCDRTAEIVQREAALPGDGVQLVNSPLSPRGTIEDSVAAYGKLTSYEDDAYVSLSYRLDGQPHTDRAPLAVAWDKRGKLGLRVYSVVAGPQDGRWRLRLQQEDSPVGDQVLSRAVPQEVNFEWLLDDPLVAQGLAAGLAGFPPQLDLLLSAQPMGGLIDDSAMLGFGPQQAIGDRACHVISVTRGGAEYQLYIDQAEMLLRRLRLPNASLPAQMLSDPRITDVQLTIELEGIRTNTEVNWSRFRVDVDSDDWLVQHFVLPPTLAETQGLGRRVPAFRLVGADGRVVYRSDDTSSPRRRATVLMWLADHPGCRLAAQQLADTARAIQADGSLAGAVDFVPIWAEPQPPAGDTFESLPQTWQLPTEIAVDRDALGRDLFGVMEAPTLIVLDGDQRIQLRESKTNPLLSQILPGVLKRLVNGEDLAASMLKEAREIEARYRCQRQNALAVDARKSSHDPLASFPPVIAELTRAARMPFPGEALAATTDTRQMMWALRRSGHLMQIDVASGKPALRHQFATPWQPPPDSHILISPQGSYVALYSPTSPQLEIYHTSTQQNRSISLPAQSVPVDIQWLQLTGSKTPRLAVITSDSQTVLLDPSNHEQLSGRCPTRPMALLAKRAVNSSIDGQVVLSDRSVEHFQLSEESAHKHLSLLGRPASHVLGGANESRSARLATRLNFAPARGPWAQWDDGKDGFTLARGWIARDEPAVFLLDQDLKPRWHYRVGLRTEPDRPMQSVAKDPASGLATWVLSDTHQTIYVLRSDGLTDYFRVEENFVGLVLLPSGDRLLLGVVEDDATVFYDVTWK